LGRRSRGAGWGSERIRKGKKSPHLKGTMLSAHNSVYKCKKEGRIQVTDLNNKEGKRGGLVL